MMSDTRWKQVRAIFEEALRREPSTRDSYLEGACSGDVELRIEVESLLISLEEAKSFLEMPLVRTSGRSYSYWQLEEGQSISHYRILRPIGAGGMGEVYLAEDEKLHRQVALKLLPKSMHADRQRLKRFRREALAVSALNHPNILTIFEADSVDGRDLLAAEFVSGETLRERLRRGPLGVEEAVDIAVQIVSALQAAHNAGIIHRDIKPENIMVREDGYVKVLDFGLAKLVAQWPHELETRSQMISNPSTLMGTASYMSPEQVRGHSTDFRTDIFSFGIVFYEMLFASQLFTGETNTDVIAAVIQKDFDWDMDVPETFPEELKGIVDRCVQKERHMRYQSADQLLEELRQVQEGLRLARSFPPGTLLPEAAKKEDGRLDTRWQSYAPIAAAFLVLLALLLLAYLLIPR